MRTNPRRRSPELDIHYAIVKAINNHGLGVPYFHPANGEKRSLVAGVRLKRMGVIPGTPDLVFNLPPNGRCAYLELKAPKGVISKEQKSFRDNVKSAGALWECAWSFDEAYGILSAWGVLPHDVGGYDPTADFSNSIDFCYDELRAAGQKDWAR